MSLNELFVLNTTIRLSADMNSWGDQIVFQLLKTYPSLSKMVGEVVFAKTEKIKGNAVGYITLINKNQRIPFIVDEYELNPLDIYIDNGKYLPLTENSIKRLESNIWPFRLISQDERNGILKTASLFESDGLLNNDFIESQKDTLIKIAQEYPDLLEDFASRNLPKYEDQFTVRCFVKEASDIKPLVVRSLIEKDKDYKISEFADKFGKDFVKELMLKGEAIISNMPPKVILALDKAELKGLYKPTEENYGYTAVDGIYTPARKYKHYDFYNLQHSTRKPYVAINANGTYFEYANLVRYIDKPSEQIEVKYDEKPRNGDYAVFIIGDSLFGPVFVNSMARIGNDIIYNVTDTELKSVNVRTNKDIKTIVKLDEDNYLVSSFARIIKINLASHYSNSKPKDFLKYAETSILISKQLDGKFTINDGGVSGIDTNKLKNLVKGDAIVVLMRSGLSENDARYVIMKAMDSGAYTFNVPNEKNEKEPVDESISKKAEEIINLCNEKHILKIATVSGDRSNVDLALGLNLITYNNIKRFKLIVPEIYQMLDRLCKLLIIKRMNRSLFEINEAELSQGVKALDDIAFSLNSL